MFMGILLSLVALFLILLVLVQRGRGGGLAGALGGMGGSSAFGAKAGDVFTRITIVAATVWIVLCIAATRFGGSSGSMVDVPGSASGSGRAAIGATGDAEDVDAGTAEAGAVEEAGAAAETADEAADATEAAGPELTPPAESTDATDATESP